MSWRDQLREASFRGAAFFVDSADNEGGRRTVTHELPGSDTAWVEDLGARVKRFRLEAYLVGPSYHVARDRLRAALEAPGPGTLVHPWWGEYQVAVDGPVRIRESTREGGLARFEISFVEVGRPAPYASAADGESLDAAATAAAAAATAALEEGFSVAGAAEHVRDDAEARIVGAATALREARGKIAARVAEVEDAAAAIAEMRDEAGDLVASPLALASAALGAIAALLAPFADLLSSGTEAASTLVLSTWADVVAELAAWGTDEVADAETTPQERIQAANRRALGWAIRTYVLAAAAESARGLPYESSDDARRVREVLVDATQAVLEEADLPDALYSTLSDLRARAVEYLAQVAAQLPRLRSFVPPATLPALVLAHLLHGDATRDAEIVARNRIRHPGFVPGGVALEVLDA